MAFSAPSNNGGMPTEEGIKEELKKQIEDGIGIVDNLVEWSKSTDKDEFEAKLMQIRPADWQKFWGADGQINRDYLAENLTSKEKFAMLASHLIGDQLLSLFFPDKTDSMRTLTMDEATEYFEKNKDKGARKVGKHLVWDATSPFAQLTTLFSLADLAKDGATETKEAFPLVPGTFWFINPSMPIEGGAKIRPTMFDVLKRACGGVGVDLKFLRPGEKVGAAPGPKEIYLSFLETTSVPLNDAQEIDYDLLDWYVSLYDRAPWMLMQGSPLLAAIHMRTRGKNDDTGARATEALSADYANIKGDANFAASLQTILPFPDVPGAVAPATPAAAPTAPVTSEVPKTQAAPSTDYKTNEELGESNPDEPEPSEEVPETSSAQ